MKSVLFALLFVLAQAHAATNIKIMVTEKGFEPLIIKSKANEEVSLTITRTTDSTCAREMVIPSLKIKQALPLNKAVTVNLGKLQKGEIKFSCGMDMYKGVINAQ